MQELERAGHKGIWEKNIPGQGTEVAKALGGDICCCGQGQQGQCGWGGGAGDPQGRQGQEVGEGGLLLQ